MSLILSGTDGLSDVDGTAATPAIRGTDANTGIFFPAADTVATSVAGVEGTRLTSTGLGIGTSSPTRKLTISGTGAFSSAAAPSIRLDDTASSRFAIIDLDSSQNLNLWNSDAGSGSTRFYRGSGSGTLSMSIDGSGNLGLGVTPSAWTRPAIQGGASATVFYYGATSTVTVSANLFYGGSNKYIGNGAATQYYQDAGVHVWENAASGTAGNSASMTERMRIDASGNLLVGTTTRRNNATLTISYSGTTNNGIAFIDTANANATEFLAFQNSSGTNIGTVARVGTTNAVVYNTTSDQRLKSNIQNSESVIDKLMQVQVRQYDWTEGSLHQDYGFIAQELEPILSGVVTKGKTDEDMWQMDYSRLTPHLLKAMQEQQALIQSLKARLDAANL